MVGVGVDQPVRPSAPEEAPSSVDTKFTRSHSAAGGAYNRARASGSTDVPGPGCRSRRGAGAWPQCASHYAAGVPPSITAREPRTDRDRLVRELVPPPRFDAERFSTYRPDPAQPSESPPFSASSRMPPGWRSAPTGTPGVRRVPGGGGGERETPASAGDLPRRRLRRRQDAPARQPVARRTGPKAFGTFVEFHEPRGGTRLCPDRRGAAGPPARVHRRVRARRPGDTVLMATLLTRLAEAGVALAEPPTPSRTRWARGGSPERTSCVRSRRSRRGSTSSPSTARTTATAATCRRRFRSVTARCWSAWSSLVVSATTSST